MLKRAILPLLLLALVVAAVGMQLPRSSGGTGAIEPLQLLKTWWGTAASASSSSSSSMPAPTASQAQQRAQPAAPASQPTPPTPGTPRAQIPRAADPDPGVGEYLNAMLAQLGASSGSADPLAWEEELQRMHDAGAPIEAQLRASLQHLVQASEGIRELVEQSHQVAAVAAAAPSTSLPAWDSAAEDAVASLTSGLEQMLAAIQQEAGLHDTQKAVELLSDYPGGKQWKEAGEAGYYGLYGGQYEEEEGQYADEGQYEDEEQYKEELYEEEGYYMDYEEWSAEEGGEELTVTLDFLAPTPSKGSGCGKPSAEPNTDEVSVSRRLLQNPVPPTQNPPTNTSLADPLQAAIQAATQAAQGGQQQPPQLGPDGKPLPDPPKPANEPARISTPGFKLQRNADGSSQVTVGRLFPIVTIKDPDGSGDPSKMNVKVGPRGGIFSVDP